jgi:hypothetical protein
MLAEWLQETCEEPPLIWNKGKGFGAEGAGMTKPKRPRPQKNWLCPKCKGEFPYTQPVIIDGCTGFATEPHDPVERSSRRCGSGLHQGMRRPSGAG